MNLVCQHECNEKAQKSNSVNAFQATMEQPSRTVVHAKLEMTTPDSPEEVEAEAAANDIVQGGKIARSIFAGSAGGGMAVSSHMEGRLNSMQGEGQAMPDGLRNMMERGFNRDFSQVRVHTDSEAASLSSSIHAKAFTHGNDIYFNQGQFSPNTSEGQKLMAHELTHVVQGTGKVGRQDTYHTEDIMDFCGYESVDNCSENNSGCVYLILYGAGYDDVDKKGHNQGDKHEKLAQTAETIIRNGAAKIKIGSAKESRKKLMRVARQVVSDENPEIVKENGVAYVIKKEIAGQSFKLRNNLDYVVVKPAYDSATFFNEINKYATPNSPKICYLGVYAHGFFGEFYRAELENLDVGINLGGRQKGINGASDSDQKNDQNEDYHCLDMNRNLVPYDNVTCQNDSDLLSFHSGRQVNPTNYKNIDPNAFQYGAQIYLWGCNHGGWINKDGKYENGIASLLKEHIGNGVEVYGFDVTTISPVESDGKTSIYSGEMLGDYREGKKSMKDYIDDKRKDNYVF